MAPASFTIFLFVPHAVPLLVAPLTLFLFLAPSSPPQILTGCDDTATEQFLASRESLRSGE
jgi:hypothetical protein